jgi:hypothetical protein
VNVGHAEQHGHEIVFRRARAVVPQVEIAVVVCGRRRRRGDRRQRQRRQRRRRRRKRRGIEDTDQLEELVDVPSVFVSVFAIFAFVAVVIVTVDEIEIVFPSAPDRSLVGHRGDALSSLFLLLVVVFLASSSSDAAAFGHAARSIVVGSVLLHVIPLRFFPAREFGQAKL